MRVSGSCYHVCRRGACVCNIRVQYPSTGATLVSFLKILSTDFDVAEARGCRLTEAPLTGELIGRDIELAHILNDLSDCGEDRRRHVIQTAAPPGCGKSAFLTKISEIIFSNSFDPFKSPPTAKQKKRKNKPKRKPPKLV